MRRTLLSFYLILTLGLGLHAQILMPGNDGGEKTVAISSDETFYDSGGKDKGIPKNVVSAITFTPRPGEVIEITGRPFSASLPRYEDIAPTVHIALRCERRLLDKRINERARAMFDGGLVEEVEALVDQGIREGETAPRAIGYAQALAVIDGTMSVPEAVDSTALATRQLASRQIKWFRRDPRLHWIDVALTEAGQCTDSERSRLTRQAWELVCARRGVA